MSKFNCEDT